MATGSIKLFQFVQKCQQIFGISLPQPNQKQLLTYSARTFFLFNFAQFMFTIAAFLVFAAKSMFDYGFVFFTIITIFNCIVVYLIFVWQSENTLTLIENCEGFIEKRTHSTTAYDKLSGEIELFNEIIIKSLCASVLTVTLTDMPYSFARYYIFNMGEDSFYLFIPVWFPFDWKTPFGYLVAWVAQFAGFIPIAFTIGQFLNLMFGFCWLFIFVAEDITHDVVAFNIANKTSSTDKKREELTKLFSDMVQIYSDAEQCVLEFNHVFKYSLFAFFLYDMLAVSSVLVAIQFELRADNSNLLKIVLLIFILIWVILVTVVLCEPGARITNQYKEFHNELKQCDWYLLSFELRRWYVIFLSGTQNPTRVLCYANIVCDRETLKKMINKAFSYFMTLRKFKA